MKSRICPKCGCEIIYNGKYYKNCYNRAKRNNSLCKPCSKGGEKNSFYGKKHSNETIEILRNKNAGKNNPMYGIGGMKGKRQSDFQKENQSKYMKNRWAKEKGISVEKMEELKSEWQKYRDEVHKITRQQSIHLLENIDKRGIAGVGGAYHLDHIYSVYRGFKNNISPEIIGNIKNLQMLPWLENQKKWYK